MIRWLVVLKCKICLSHFFAFSFKPVVVLGFAVLGPCSVRARSHQDPSTSPGGTGPPYPPLSSVPVLLSDRRTETKPLERRAKSLRVEGEHLLPRSVHELNAQDRERVWSLGRRGVLSYEKQ